MPPGSSDSDAGGRSRRMSCTRMPRGVRGRGGHPRSVGGLSSPAASPPRCRAWCAACRRRHGSPSPRLRRRGWHHRVAVARAGFERAALVGRTAFDGRIVVRQIDLEPAQAAGKAAQVLLDHAAHPLLERVGAVNLVVRVQLDLQTFSPLRCPLTVVGVRSKYLKGLYPTPRRGNLTSDKVAACSRAAWRGRCPVSLGRSLRL